MQRKVFRLAGVAVLATRDGRLFETAAMLARLIAEDERQQRALAAWQVVTAPAPEEPPAPTMATTGDPIPAQPAAR